MKTVSIIASSILVSNTLFAALAPDTTQNLIATYTKTIATSEKTVSSLNSSIQMYEKLVNTTSNANLKNIYIESLKSLKESLAKNQETLQGLKDKLELLQNGKTVVVKPIPAPPITQIETNTTVAPAPVDPLTIPDTITNKPTMPSTSSTEYKNTRNFQYTGVETAWAQGYTGAGVTVGVVDTGLTPYNDDVSRFFKTSNIIEYINVYNTKTKSYDYTQLSGGMIAYIRINANNATYSQAPIITINGTGTGATAVAIMNGNKIQSIQITNPGSGYTGVPTVVITDAITGQKITTTTATPLLAGYDMMGHGTAVTSIIAGANNGSGLIGVAPDANVIMTKITNLSNTIELNSIIDGTNAMAVAGAKIINQSLQTYNTLPISVINSYVNLSQAGVTFVTAAGNDGKTCSTISSCNQFATVPLVTGGASISSSSGAWIVVGALNANATDIASWSNRAGLLKNYYILAPGTDNGISNYVSSTTMKGSGTSFAAPIVAGAMALLQQRWTKLSGAQQVQILFQTADDMGVKGVDDIYGWGKLNLTKAFSPVGDLVVPTSIKTASGLSTAKTLSAYKTSVSGSAIVTAKLASFKALDSTVGYDSFQRDFSVNMTNSVSISKQTFGFDQFLTVPITRDGRWFVGANKIYEAPMVGYRLNSGLALSYSMVKGYFGSSGEGALAYGGQTHYMNLDYSTIKQDTGIQVSATYGYAVAKNQGESMLQMKDAQCVGIRAKAVYDGLGVVYNIPGKVIKGSANAIVPIGLNSDDNVVYSSSSNDLTKGAFERQVGLIFQKSNISLQFDKTIDQYNIAGLNSTNLRVNAQWNW